MTTAILAITTDGLGDERAAATADIDRMNAALRERAADKLDDDVTLVETQDELNLLIAGNGYQGAPWHIIDEIYEAIVCDETFYADED